MDDFIQYEEMVKEHIAAANLTSASRYLDFLKNQIDELPAEKKNYGRQRHSQLKQMIDMSQVEIKNNK